jgi:Zn-dependent peptidase ImmA (M78 family)
MRSVRNQSESMEPQVAGCRDRNALCGEHGAGAGVGRRILGAQIGPGLQVVERINDAAADFAIRRPGSIGAMLLKRAAGKPEKSRSLERAQKARRQAGKRVRHWHHHRGRVLFCGKEDIGNFANDAMNPERHADAFASDLILPNYLLVPRLKTIKKLTLAAARDLSDKFCASLTATLIKITLSNEFPMVIACYNKIKRRWFERAPMIQPWWLPVRTMLKILVDTCVWLDLAKDPKQANNLRVLEELVKENAVELIVPQTVLDEFARNKTRVTEENAKSIASTLKRAKDIIVERGDARRIRSAMKLLNAADYQIPGPKDAAKGTVARIEALLKSGTLLPISDAMKVRASNRAIDGRAPFHRGKNSINDALLIEAYGEFSQAQGKGVRCAFATHNYKDFSDTNHKAPHPDIAAYFSKIKSRYFILLGDALKSLRAKGYADWIFEMEEQPARSLDEITDAIDEFVTKVWYNRHMNLRWEIEHGKVKVIEKYDPRRHNTTITRDILEGALKAAEKVEKRFKGEQLQWDDFEWGMLNGKLSALRWVLGDEWDMLDT